MGRETASAVITPTAMNRVISLCRMEKSRKRRMASFLLDHIPGQTQELGTDSQPDLVSCLRIHLETYPLVFQHEADHPSLADESRDVAYGQHAHAAEFSRNLWWLRILRGSNEQDVATPHLPDFAYLYDAHWMAGNALVADNGLQVFSERGVAENANLHGRVRRPE